MKLLGFPEPRAAGCTGAHGKRLRRACFESRSCLPVGAACVVANGTRETLSPLLGAPVVMRLFEPSLPSPQAWEEILRDARLYRVRGHVADAAIVLRAADARALIAALFGESHAETAPQRDLSPIECDVLDRLAAAIASNLAAVCGARESHPVERTAAIAGFATYFELFVEEPLGARIGIALSRDPAPQGGGSIGVGHLAAVAVTARASLDVGLVEASALTHLAVGATLPISAAHLLRCDFTVHGRRLARGSVGARNGRYALSLNAQRDAG